MTQTLRTEIRTLEEEEVGKRLITQLDRVG